MEAATI